MNTNRREHPSGVIPQHYSDIIRSSAGEAEQMKSLHAKQLRVIFEAGWLKLFVPPDMGGLGWPLPEALRMEEALSWSDGSTGWVVTLCAGAGWFTGFIAPDVANEFLADPKMCFAGSGAASGVAYETSDGYRITGAWRYASGALHATAFTANCCIYRDGVQQFNADGTPEISAFIFRKGEVNLQNHWESIGMVATGSHSFKVKDILVPQDRRFVIDAESAVLPDAVYRYPFLQLAETTLSVNLAGMAVRFVDLCEDLFSAKRTNGLSASRMSEHVQLLLDRAIADLDGHRHVFYDAVQRSWELCKKGVPMPPDLLKQVSQSSYALARTSLRIVDELYPWCGLIAANPREEINRVWRNIHTASQHALFRMG